MADSLAALKAKVTEVLRAFKQELDAKHSRKLHQESRDMSEIVSQSVDRPVFSEQSPQSTRQAESDVKDYASQSSEVEDVMRRVGPIVNS